MHVGRRPARVECGHYSHGAAIQRMSKLAGTSAVGRKRPAAAVAEAAGGTPAAGRPPVGLLERDQRGSDARWPAFEPGAHVQLRSSRDRFLGYAYVNPRTLISARLLAAIRTSRPACRCCASPIETALALRERLYARTVLPARLRRGRPAAGPGRRPLRRRARRADRHGRHGGDEGRHRHRSAGAGRGAAGRAMEERLTDPRLEGLPRYVETAFGEVPDSVVVPEGGVHVPRAARQRPEDRLVLRPGGQPRVVCRIMRGAPACSTCSAMRAASACRLRGPGPPRSPASIPRRRRSMRRPKRQQPMASTLEARKATLSSVLEALHAERPAIRRDRARSTGLHQAPQGPSQGPRGLQAPQPARAAAASTATGCCCRCSCSWHLAPGELTDAVQRAARHLDRFAQLIAVGAQAPDHPVHPAIDETRYLRAFLFRVTDAC